MTNLYDEEEIIKRLGVDPVIDDNTVWLLIIPNTICPSYSYDWDDYAESVVWKDLLNKGDLLISCGYIRSYQIFPKFMKNKLMGRCIDQLEAKMKEQQHKMRELIDSTKKNLHPTEIKP